MGRVMSKKMYRQLSWKAVSAEDRVQLGNRLRLSYEREDRWSLATRMAREHIADRKKKNKAGKKARAATRKALSR